EAAIQLSAGRPAVAYARATQGLTHPLASRPSSNMATGLEEDNLRAMQAEVAGHHGDARPTVDRTLTLPHRLVNRKEGAGGKAKPETDKVRSGCVRVVKEEADERRTDGGEDGEEYGGATQLGAGTQAEKPGRVGGDEAGERGECEDEPAAESE